MSFWAKPFPVMFVLQLPVFGISLLAIFGDIGGVVSNEKRKFSVYGQSTCTALSLRDSDNFRALGGPNIWRTRREARAPLP